ncbi:MAG: glycosyl transferase group 1 [Schlesneria sp.]|nr:glycosyl transferase group 1 [Schlesneria sp.]
MKVLVCVEHRFDRSPDGAIWTQVAYDHSFWLRYLDVFDSVQVLARIRDVPQAPADYVRADGDRVNFTEVPYYLGPWQYLRQRNRVKQAVRDAVEPRNAIILRVGSQLANCLYPALRNSGQPFGVEVVGDPWDVFAPGSISHPLRPMLRWYFWHELRKQCANACAASYVTERALQSRYPVRGSTLSISASSINLKVEALRSVRKSFAVSDVRLSLDSYTPMQVIPRQSGCLRLVFVGSLAQLYKGPDILLAACAECIGNGVPLRLVLIGDGKFRAQLESQAESLGIRDCVVFRGQLPAGRAIRDELDRADLFVLPSRTEGLPRALIEAMARSLPCIASNVGGIPELLPDADLVPAGDVHALAQKIQEVIACPKRQEEMRSRNYLRAQDFREDVLQQRRVEFFEAVRRLTTEWQTSRRAA